MLTWSIFTLAGHINWSQTIYMAKQAPSLHVERPLGSCYMIKYSNHIHMAGETFMAFLPFEGIGFDPQNRQNNIAAC